MLYSNQNNYHDTVIRTGNDHPDQGWDSSHEHLQLGHSPSFAEDLRENVPHNRYQEYPEKKSPQSTLTQESSDDEVFFNHIQQRKKQ